MYAFAFAFFAVVAMLSAPSAVAQEPTSLAPSPAAAEVQPKEFGKHAYRGQDATHPKVRKSVDPMYTTEARLARITGQVVFEAVVEADGTVGETRILKSALFSPGETTESPKAAGLRDDAESAAKAWLFDPAKLDGTPVAVIIKMEFAFRLSPPILRRR